jgi:soluble lytic murein transglycosylase-like protein
MKKLIYSICLYSTSLFSMEHQAVVKACKSENYPDCRLISAIAAIESGYNQFAVNNQGKRPSLGLMQLELRTARFLGFKGAKEDLFNIKTNVKYGIKYIKWLQKRYTRLDHVISAYNAGKVRTCYTPQKCYIHEYPNHKYVKKVLKFWRSL